MEAAARNAQRAVERQAAEEAALQLAAQTAVKRQQANVQDAHRVRIYIDPVFFLEYRSCIYSYRRSNLP